MCKKNVEFTWTQKQNKASKALKKALTSKPLIKIFDPKIEVTLTTDTSEHAIATVVSQEGHPIIYLSRKLSSAESNYCNIEKEALAIVWSIERTKNFLLGKKVPLKIRPQAPRILIRSRKRITQSNIIKNFKVCY